MQIYWSLGSVPELRGLPKRERFKVWKVHFWECAESKDTLPMILAVFLAAVLLVALHGGDVEGIGRSLRMLESLVLVAIGAFVFVQPATHRMRSILAGTSAEGTTRTHKSVNQADSLD
jgi:hypothetical protein